MGIRNSGRLAGIAGAVALGALIAGGAAAQSTYGSIVGEAAAGDTVIVNGPDIGFHRELAIKEDGKYQLRRVPLGDYVVTVKRADGTFTAAKTVTVKVGSTARVQ